MKALLQPVILYVTLVLSTIHINAKRASNFEQVLSPEDVQALCGTDEPNEVDHLLPGGRVQCGMKCISGDKCEAFNFNDHTGQCDRYHNVPNNYSPVAGYTSHQRKGRNNIEYTAAMFLLEMTCGVRHQILYSF